MSLPAGRQVRGKLFMNVVVIVCDTLRIDDMGCCGNRQIRTPHFDRLAKEGTFFRNFYAEGLPTVPVRTAFFTGRYTLPFRPWQHLEPDDILLAELLWAQGYASALVTDTYHLHKPKMGFGRGFDYVEWVRGREDDPAIVGSKVKVDVNKYYQPPQDGRIFNQWGTKKLIKRYLLNRTPWNAAHGWQTDGDHFEAQVIKGGIKWLEKQLGLGRQDKLFLWLDIFAPHDPIDPPPPFDHMYTDPKYKGKDIIIPMVRRVKGYIDEPTLDHIRRLRWGFITFIDKWVGILIDWLRDRNMLDNTLLIWTTDHGDFFGEHGIIEKCRPWPYDILSHIPMVIRHPKGMGRGKSVESFVQTPDLMPTILDFLKVPVPEQVHGKSLLPVLKNPRLSLHDFAISGWHGGSSSIRTRQWSYYRWHGNKQQLEEMERTKGPELYDRQGDPNETRNIIKKNPKVAKELDSTLSRFIKSLK